MMLFGLKMCRSAILVGSVVLLIYGCRHHQSTQVIVPPVPPAATQSAPPPLPPTVAAVKVQNYSNAAGGISFDYPADWKPEPTKTSVLDVTNAPTNAVGHASLSLDIPKLPWHVPGMIPCGMVTSDYASDVRKNQIPDAVVQENVAFNIPGANARRVTSVGHFGGHPSIDIAVVMIHNDHVYILSVDSDDIGRDTAAKALDAAVASLKWATK